MNDTTDIKKTAGSKKPASKVDTRMDIWDAVFETAPSAVKPPTTGTKGLSSIAAQYYWKRATEQFGPCGLGWGYEIVEERVDEMGDILDQSKPPVKIGTAKTHTVMVKLWFMVDGQRGEITNYGHTTMVMKTKYGISFDEEAPKKSLTDGIKKCLTMLGIGGDVHMSYHDDRGYVGDMQQKEALEKADNKADAVTQMTADLDEWLNKELEAISYLNTKNAITTAHNNIMKGVKRKAALCGADIQALENKINGAFNEQVAAVKAAKSQAQGETA